MTDEWRDPENIMGLWEYQLEPLTVRRLIDVLADAPRDALVTADYSTNTGDHIALRVMHIDERAQNGTNPSVMFTLA